MQTTDPITIRDYLEGLYGPSAEGNLVIFERDDANTIPRHFVTPYGDRQKAITRLAAQPPGVHIYVAVALHDQQALENRTRKAETAVSAAFLALDIDLKSGVHAAANLPVDEEQAIRLLRETGLPEPNLIVHSGGGLYPLWQLAEPLRLGDASDRHRFERLWKAWNEQARETWDKHGLKLDVISDLARVLRVPGTLNPKTNPPRPVRLFSIDNGERWTLDQLEEIVAPRLAARRERPSNRAEGTLAATLKQECQSGTSETAPGLFAMVTACGFLRSCDENAHSLTEPEWKDAADVFAHVPDGRRYFHQLSARDPRYSFEETEDKLERASRYPPKLCATIAAQHPPCRGCLFRHVEAVRTPARLAMTDPALAMLQARYVLDTKTGLFFDAVSGRDKTKEDFDRSFTRDMRKKQPASTAFRNSKVSCFADEHDYLVGNAELIVEEEGARILNTWKDGGVVAREGDPSIWLYHLEYMIPDDSERKWVLQYLAYLVQRPAGKIKSVIVLQSQQGVGKNLLVRCIGRMFHENDVRELYGSVLGDRWQADMGNARLLALDELQIDDLKAAYNRLKRWATEEFQSVERKGVDAFSVRTPRGIVIMTNSHKPMAIEHDDRRLFVCKVEAAKRDEDYYRRLVECGLSDDGVASFKHYLHNVDLTGFDANGQPPLTRAKQELIRASASIPEQIIVELRENGSWPFDRPVYLAEDVASAIEARTRRPVTSQQITPVLKRLGDRRRDTKTSIQQLEPRRAYVWAWQDVDKWLNASNEEVQGALRGPTAATSSLPFLIPLSGVQLSS